MDYIKVEDIDNIEIRSSIPVLLLLDEFLINISHELNINVSDIKEFMGLNNETEKINITAKSIAYQWIKSGLNWFQMTEDEKDNIRSIHPELPYERIEFFLKEIQDRKDRCKNLLPKIYKLIKGNIDKDQKPIGIFKQFLELLSKSTNKSEEMLFNTDLKLLFEIASRIIYKPETEKSKAFFTSRVVKALLNDSYIQTFIENVLKIIQMK